MKALFTSLLLIITSSLFSQEVVGDWSGVLEVGKTKLTLVLHLKKEKIGYSATLDSPDQFAYDIPASSVKFQDSVLDVEVMNGAMKYYGKLQGDHTFDGKFTQGDVNIPLHLARLTEALEKKKRSQEPSVPFPYSSEEISIQSSDNVVISGTLTKPKNVSKPPVVILVSGSGPQNRNEELMGHKPFLVISDYLTRNGIAVFRYDDRGTAKSTGNHDSATSHDFANDTEAIFNFLRKRKDLNRKKIGIMGHSEGGMIAPMVAARNKKVGFAILLAGPGTPGDELLLTQQTLINEASGVPSNLIDQEQKLNRTIYDLILQAENEDSLINDFKKFTNSMEELPFGDSKDENLKFLINHYCNSWMFHFIRYNPNETLEKIKCPVLALNGSKDLQVSSKENLDGIQKALSTAKNKDFTIQELEGMNHLFQECETGLPSEYGVIDQTFSPKALSIILEWIQARF